MDASSLISPYKTKSAVLFLLFNRPGTTQQVFDQIKLAQPKRLYVAADGPRSGNAADVELCKQTRNIIKGVDWECEVKTLFREKNGGCKEAVSAAVNWFFEQEEEGIVLEDDCLPANSFFRYCDTLLEKYRYDSRIRHITGCNLQQGNKWGDCTYYFSNISHVWGWAGWRRVWKDYDKNLSRYDKDEAKRHLSDIFPNPIIADCWAKFFADQKDGKINSWAFPLTFINFFNNGLCAIPNENLISNLGFHEGATHTINKDSLNANIPLSEIGEIKHPMFIIPEKRADEFSLGYEFNVDETTRKQNLPRRRLKRWFKSLFAGNPMQIQSSPMQRFAQTI